MEITILRNGNVIASCEGNNESYIVFNEEYQQGDEISFKPSHAGFYTIQFDHVLGRSTVYTDGSEYRISVPFEQKHDCYHPFAFKGNKHFLWAREAYEWEYGYRNLSLNPYDCHENTALYPHASANIETRGESVFAARNAIDGIVASNNHGLWPYASWGINRDPKAAMTIDFGRDVLIDRIVFYDRADFPLDAWWEKATITFSDGSSIDFDLIKKDGPQMFTFQEKKISSLVLDSLIKADDPSPFPALIQLEVYGKEA